MTALFSTYCDCIDIHCGIYFIFIMILRLKHKETISITRHCRYQGIRWFEWLYVKHLIQTYKRPMSSLDFVLSLTLDHIVFFSNDNLYSNRYQRRVNWIPINIGVPLNA